MTGSSLKKLIWSHLLHSEYTNLFLMGNKQNKPNTAYIFLPNLGAKNFHNFKFMCRFKDYLYKCV